MGGNSCFLIGNSNKIPLQVEVVFFFPPKKWIENDQNSECTSCSLRDYTPIWGSRDIRINSNPSSRRNNRNHYRRLQGHVHPGPFLIGICDVNSTNTRLLETPGGHFWLLMSSLKVKISGFRLAKTNGYQSHKDASDWYIYPTFG